VQRPLGHSNIATTTRYLRLSDADVADRPIRIFGGSEDDYNPIVRCKAYVERLRAAGRDVELTEYPGAAHAFDNPLGAQPAAVFAKFESARDCRIREEPEGVLKNLDTGAPFTYRDGCVQHGPHLGFDPAAAQAAGAAVRVFLKSVLKTE